VLKLKVEILGLLGLLRGHDSDQDLPGQIWQVSSHRLLEDGNTSYFRKELFFFNPGGEKMSKIQEH